MSVTARSILFEMGDNADALTVENVYQRWANFGGIQKFNFDDSITGVQAAHWTTITNVSYSGDNLARSGTVAAEHVSWYDTDMPHSYTVEFTVHQPVWGFVFRGDGSNNYYQVKYDHSTPDYVTFSKITAGTPTILGAKELKDWEVVNWGRVRIAVRDAQFSADSPGRIIYISVWLNDNIIFTSSFNVSSNNPPLRMGLLVPAGASGHLYSNFRVPNLGEVIIWSSLDPGENPMSAIQRAIEDRYIKQWIRWDGSLRAWVPKARNLSRQITASKELHLSAIVDLKQVFSHVRVLGAFQWVQVFDQDLINKVGHRFREINNTSLWNADDCQRIGAQLIMRAKEQADQIRIDTYGMVFNETEDRIQVPDVSNPGGYLDYIIDNINWQYQAGTFLVSITGRRYFY